MHKSPLIAIFMLYGSIHLLIRASIASRWKNQILFSKYWWSWVLTGPLTGEDRSCGAIYSTMRIGSREMLLGNRRNNESSPSRSINWRQPFIRFTYDFVSWFPGPSLGSVAIFIILWRFTISNISPAIFLKPAQVGYNLNWRKKKS